MLERKQEFLNPVWSVPLPQNIFFTARESTLEEVHKKLLSSKRVALSGMRGVGKTRTAVEYVYRHREHYLAILWARAETRDTLTGDFAAIARLLDLPQKDEKDQSIIVAAVKSWLEANNNWLLVLDNVDDLALVRDFVPLTHPGRLLLTTTAQASGQVAEKIKVEEMTEDEGALLLLRRAKVITSQAPFSDASPADQKNARQLAEQLGGLPLALDQAGAYIEETFLTLAQYLELYKKEGTRLLKERGEFSGDHPSVFLTFSLAFVELAKRDSTAADLVRLCAFLAPDAIPEEIFAKGSTDLGEEFKKRVANPLDFAETVKQAAKFSLINRDAQDRSLDIHRLVQEVLKGEMSVEQRRIWAESAVRTVNATLPEIDFRNWPDCERLLPHIQICRLLIDEFSFEFREAGHLLYQTAHYLTERGQYGGIEPIYQRALTICEKAYGPQDSAVAKILNDLALLYRRLERYAEAEPLYKRSVEIYEKALGPDHPYVATCLDNLARLYDIQGRYAEAELLNKRSQAIFEKALKPDHPDVANNVNNLAMLYHHQGRYAEAEPLYQRALEIRRKELGPNHPTVATSLNNLATNYHDQERYDEAEKFYKQALTIYEKALGPDHPYIAVSLGSYAALLRKIGRNAEAEPLEARVLAIRAKQQAQENPGVN
jgi:tetratricopeptide (TPR) repeat protein